MGRLLIAVFFGVLLALGDEVDSLPQLKNTPQNFDVLGRI